MIQRAVQVPMALAAALCAGAAGACLPPDKPLFWIDKKIKVEADCSYSRAEDNYYSSMTAGPAVEIGNGKFGQRLSYSNFCSSHEKLLVVDCDAAKLIVIKGKVDPADPGDYGGGPSTTVDVLYPPRGRVRLTRDVSIDGLAALSKKAGYEYSTDAEAVFGAAKEKNRYNPYCGCGVFYPDSLGAKR